MNLQPVRFLDPLRPWLSVESRGNGRWAIFCYGELFARDGTLVYEPLPSSRTEEFISRTRWDWDEVEPAVLRA